MEYNDDARLDTSQVQDARGSGGIGRSGGLAVGGGGLGLVALIVVILMNLLGGGSSADAAGHVLSQLGSGGGNGTVDNGEIQSRCTTGADANKYLECAVVADIDSIQAYWAAETPKLGKQYSQIPTVWFTGQVSTGCGAATSGSGPFYCPADKRVYIDLTFYDDLKTQFGATGGPFVNAYVLAHEYGHHVQDILGIESKVTPGETGPTSGPVRLELQADCFAGVWAKHATEPENGNPPLITSISQQDFDNALDTAGRIGDDYIQTHLGNGTDDPNSYTHGTSEQRRKWLTTGYRTGDPNACDTFNTNDLD